MHVRIVDYVANLGGGVRFAAEMVRVLQRDSRFTFTIVSYGEAADRYRSIIKGTAILDLRPVGLWRAHTFMAGIPGAGALNRILGSRRYHFAVPDCAFDGSDVAWFPWLHRHRIPARRAAHTVGSLHDVITLDFAGVVPPEWAREERDTTRRWIDSSARIILSSNATAQRLESLFHTEARRFTVIPLSGDHSRPPPGRVPEKLAGVEYLLTPANISPHKNHELLLRGVAAWGARRPLVLTGDCTDLWSGGYRRAAVASVAAAAGLERDRTIHGLGYVDDPTYYALLDNAWAVVMPTLAEGGGSFPVWEALKQGIPVVTSDIPVMREMVARTGGTVIWFNATDPLDLAAKLRDLEVNYARHKAQAVTQVAELRSRAWGDVANDYIRVLQATGPRSYTPR